MKVSHIRFLVLPLCLAAVMTALAACNMESESYISPAKIDMEQEQIHETVPLSDMDDETADLVAAHYKAHGVSPIEVTLTYPAAQKEKIATAQVQKVGDLLRRHGLTDLTLTILPVAKGGHTGDVLLTYTSVTAHPPKDCGIMPMDDRSQITGNTDGEFKAYRFGCGVDSYIASQVARPKDLLGTTNMDSAAGDRAAGRMKGYRAGEDMKALSGTSASESK